MNTAIPSPKGSALSQTLKRYLRFGLVGASGVAVDMGVLFLLADKRMLGLNLVWSKAIAVEVAIINNFIWNEFWTFGGMAAISNPRNTRWGRLFRFNLICLAGMGWSILLLQLQVHGLGWNVYLANLIAIVLVSFWNFGLSLKYGWKA